MNGESAFGWLKVAVALIALALVAFVAYKLADFLKGFDVTDPKKNPLAPVGDAIGGAFATLREKLSGDDAKIKAMLKGSKPIGIDMGSVYVGDVPTTYDAPTPAQTMDFRQLGGA